MQIHSSKSKCLVEDYVKVPKPTLWQKICSLFDKNTPIRTVLINKRLYEADCANKHVSKREFFAAWFAELKKNHPSKEGIPDIPTSGISCCVDFLTKGAIKGEREQNLSAIAKTLISDPISDDLATFRNRYLSFMKEKNINLDSEKLGKVILQQGGSKEYLHLLTRDAMNVLDGLLQRAAVKSKNPKLRSDIKKASEEIKKDIAILKNNERALSLEDLFYISLEIEDKTYQFLEKMGLLSALDHIPKYEQAYKSECIRYFAITKIIEKQIELETLKKFG